MVYLLRGRRTRVLGRSKAPVRMHHVYCACGEPGSWGTVGSDVRYPHHLFILGVLRSEKTLLSF